LPGPALSPGKSELIFACGKISPKKKKLRFYEEVKQLSGVGKLG